MDDSAKIHPLLKRNTRCRQKIERYVAQMRQPGTLRASLNHYGYIPQMAEQTAELAREKLRIPMLAWGGVRSFGSHCIDSAKAISVSAEGGVIEECGHWVFEEKTDFICEQLAGFLAAPWGVGMTAPSRRLCGRHRRVPFQGSIIPVSPCHRSTRRFRSGSMRWGLSTSIPGIWSTAPFWRNYLACKGQQSASPWLKARDI